MSEERFDRIESQLAQLLEILEQNMLATQLSTQPNSCGIDQNLTTLNQNLNALREDLVNLRHQIDRMVNTRNLMIREGFKSLMPYNDDLNYEIGDNARQTRLLKRRVIRLEGKDKEDK